MGLEKYLGAKAKGAVRVQSDEETLTIHLQGAFWNRGPLANEKKWLEYLQQQPKGSSVVIEFKQCPEIGVYTMGWIAKLGRALKSQGSSITLKAPPKKVSKLIEALGVSFEKNGLAVA